MRRRPSSRSLAVVGLLVSLALLAGAVRLWEGRVDPATISQKEMHRIGTTSDAITMSPRPRPRRVVVSRVTAREMAEVLESYLPPRFGPGPAAAITGYFDPDTGEIHITGRIPRIQASLPSPLLQGTFRHALRHEYGHALLDEWLTDVANVRRADPDDFPGPAAESDLPVFDAPSITQETGLATPAGTPRQLRPLIEEYVAVRPRIYGSEYYTSTFEEYFAESYARFLVGRSVPIRTRRFLEQWATRR